MWTIPSCDALPCQECTVLPLQEYKRTRDQDRMTAFILKKNFQELPFYEINSEDLAFLFPKSLFLHLQYKAELRCCRNEINDEISKANSMADNFNKVIESLKEKCENDQAKLKQQ
ncbi:hypothetical protein MAR_031886, partial [Mya arenaria]